MKTVFNHTLIGWTNFHENQLVRCKTHKTFEANIVLNMPQNTSFVDVGAHYGDTILTMALYAKEIKRNDLRFFAFEPNTNKCNHIKNIANLNNSIVSARSGASSFKLSEDGDVDIIRLDDVKDDISPVGCMHIDTEGWECHVLKGMQSILNDINNKGMYIIAECWSDDVSQAQVKKGRAKGVISEKPETCIHRELSVYDHIKFVKTLVDMDRNLVFMFE
jgi:hypothetical protein